MLARLMSILLKIISKLHKPMLEMRKIKDSDTELFPEREYCQCQLYDRIGETDQQFL